MKRPDARAKFLGAPRLVPFTHDGAALQLRAPKLEDLVVANGMKSERLRDSFLAFKCVLDEDGAPIFETFEEVRGLDCEKALLIDAAAKGVREMLGAKDPAKVDTSPMPVPDLAKAAEALAKGE